MPDKGLSERTISSKRNSNETVSQAQLLLSLCTHWAKRMGFALIWRRIALACVDQACHVLAMLEENGPETKGTPERLRSLDVLRGV